MTKIIAFTGYKGTGKTTASQYLIDKYGFVKHSFKDALIAEIKEKFPDLLREMLETEQSNYEEIDGFTVYPRDIDWLFQFKPPLMRALMQNYGTEVRRGYDPDYWAIRWETAARNTGVFKSNVVVDDVRFMNEAKAVKSCGGTIIRLTRPDLPSGGDHKSETEQDEIEADYTIVCEPGNLEKLYTDLEKIVSPR